jgi:hypothetical protein
MRGQLSSPRASVLAVVAAAIALGGASEMMGGTAVDHSRAQNRPTAVADAAVSRVLGASQPRFFATKHGGSLAVTAGGVAARFSPRVAQLRSAGVSWDLATIGGGHAPTVSRNRVTYTAGALHEWFASGPLGVEQGFTLERRVGTGPTVSLNVGRLPSGVRALISASGRDATLERGAQAALRYDGLVARDQRGRPLAATLVATGGRLSIDVDVRDASYPVTVDPLVQQAILTSADSGGDLGHSALAISGNTIVAGARLAGGDSGAVDVFVEPSGGWADLSTDAASLTDGTSNNLVGRSVAIDGDTIVAGAQGSSGYADVFVKPVGGWADTATPTAVLSDPASSGTSGFGGAVAVSGATIAVGNKADTGGNGLVDVFVEPPSGGWSAGGSIPNAITTPTEKLTDAAATIPVSLGASVAVSGTTVVAGAPAWGPSTTVPASGAALVYVEPSGGWGSTGATDSIPTATLTPSSASHRNSLDLGYSVAISGGTLVAGAPQWVAPGTIAEAGAAYLFSEPNGGWSSGTETAVLTASDRTSQSELGTAVAVSGSSVIVGDPFHGTGGSVYIYQEPSGGWGSANQSEELNDAAAGTNAVFGNAVAIDGSTVVASADPALVGRIDVFQDTTLSIATTALAGATQGQAYSGSLSASGGSAPYEWSATGLPPGTSINTSTGTITGTPTAPGNYTPTFTVSDDYGETATQTLSLAVATAITAPVGLRNLTLPQITGTILAKQTVGCSPGTWSEPATYGYKWFALERIAPSTALTKLKSGVKTFGVKKSTKKITSRFGSPIPPNVSVTLATGPSYSIGYLDAPLTFYCAVTATAPGNSPVSANSPVEIVAASPPQLAPPSRLHPRPAKPHIVRNVGVGGANTCTAGDWLGDPKFSYAWYVVSKPGGKKLKHLGSAQTLTVDGTAESDTIQCLVTAKNSAGSASAWSNAYAVPPSAPQSLSVPLVSIATQDPKTHAQIGAAGGAGIAQIVDLTCGSGKWNRSDLKYSPEWVVTSIAYPTAPQPGASLHFDMRPGHLQYELTAQCIVTATTSHGVSSTAKSGPISLWNGCTEWYSDVLDSGTVDAQIGPPQGWLFATTPDQLFDYDEAGGTQVNGLFGMAGGGLDISGPSGQTQSAHRAATEGPNCGGYGAYLDGQGYSVKQVADLGTATSWLGGGSAFF